MGFILYFISFIIYYIGFGPKASIFYMITKIYTIIHMFS